MWYRKSCANRGCNALGSYILEQTRLMYCKGGCSMEAVCPPKELRLHQSRHHVPTSWVQGYREAPREKRGFDTELCLHSVVVCV